jgi:hypothetical protein
MLRFLQGSPDNVDAQCTADVAMVRGRFVNKDVANKKAILPTGTDGATEIYIVDRGLVNDISLDVTEAYSDYETVLETIKAGEFVNLITPEAGKRYATTEYSGVDADFAAGKYLTVSTTADATQGKLIASATNAKTKIKSLGYYMDANKKKLVAFEFIY